MLSLYVWFLFCKVSLSVSLVFSIILSINRGLVALSWLWSRYRVFVFVLSLLHALPRVGLRPALLDFSLTVKAAPHECIIRTSQP